MARPDILNQVRVRIEQAKPGDIFIPADFSDLGEACKITMCLSRLLKEGTLEKVKRGIYMKPRFSKLLNCSVPPREDAVAKAIARNYGWTIIPFGDTALNRLGLSTQLDEQVVVREFDDVILKIHGPAILAECKRLYF